MLRRAIELTEVMRLERLKFRRGLKLNNIINKQAVDVNNRRMCILVYKQKARSLTTECYLTMCILCVHVCVSMCIHVCVC